MLCIQIRRLLNWQFIANSLLIYTPNVDLSGNFRTAFDLNGALIKTNASKSSVINNGHRDIESRKSFIYLLGIKEKVQNLLPH